MATRSPLAPEAFPNLRPLSGVRAKGIGCGIRYKTRKDLLLVELAPGSTVAGVFTRSLTAAAPVLWSRQAMAKGRVRAVVVNSGNANAFTGRRGEQAVLDTVSATARLVGCRRHEVFVASTGVIGEPLPVGRIVAALPKLRRQLSGRAWLNAAETIMTTDTFPKGATRTAVIGGARVRLNGIAKGSGMIAPDMATMLAFVFTDAKIPPTVLQRMLTRANARSFNSITVDGDTSTSDTVLLCASGQVRHARVSAVTDPLLADFRSQLEDLLQDLAKQVVRDGEGAHKLVTIDVAGAASEGAARRIGLAVANSPLVKTAIAGEDPNWGRIVMAVGKAGERADRDLLTIRIGGIDVARDGGRVPDFDEAPVAAHMKGEEIHIEIDVGIGRGRARVWTCDLTHGYISINADYRS
ncbi:MAG: bifunctional glutamate N-acetyltransferase/amino-acid acetyltransferase ArgJ [Alphaproteobacteria bacterium]|nr:bifunctional glutamate N-acetyltransferase/amino-acid acetyltransferase ArgJ [Alphaproteobacteria bacterium]